MASLPKSIIKKYGITKKAWSVFRGRKKKSRSSPRTRNVKTRRKGGNKMTRRKKRRGGGKSIVNTAMKWIRVGALVANPVRIAMIPGASWENKVTWIFQDYTGFNIQDGSFEAGRLAKGWGPYALACLTTYGIPKLASIIRRL